MKRMKKILAVLLAAIMVMSLGTSVFAEESATTTYTITISNSESGYSYAAYQIFAGDLSNGTLSNITWGSGVKSGETSNLLNALKNIGTDGTIGGNEGDSPFKDCTDAKSVAKVLANYQSEDGAVAQAFAEVVADYLSSTATGSASTLSKGENYLITSLYAGYYLVETTGVPSSGSDTAYTRYILEVVGDVTVTEKKSVPSVTKTVTNTDGGKSKTASASAGETVSFTLTATMPSTYSDYNTYALTFHDTLSTNLTYDDNSLTVTVNTYEPRTGLSSFVNDTTYYTLSEGNYTEVTDTSENTSADTTYYVYTTTTVASTGGGYTLTTDSDSISDGCSLEVSIANTHALKDSNENTISVNESTTIVVTYSATVTSGISSTTFETNTVKLEYSNNPNSSSDTGTTTEDTVYVYTYDLKVYKTDGNGNALSGAKFTLYKAVSVTETTFGTESEEYYTYSEGATAMTAVGSDAAFYSETTYYVKVNETENATETGSDSEQVATFNDLGEGTYVLEESTTPDGYNTAALVQFTVSANYADNGTSVSTLSTDNNSVSAMANSTSTLTTTVENEKGSTLPSTGGIGTTIFYIIGAILVLGAGVILITRRRMASR